MQCTLCLRADLPGAFNLGLPARTSQGDHLCTVNIPHLLSNRDGALPFRWSGTS